MASAPKVATALSGQFFNANIGRKSPEYTEVYSNVVSMRYWNGYLGIMDLVQVLDRSLTLRSKDESKGHHTTVIHRSASSKFAHGAACSRQRRFSNKLILNIAKYLSLKFERTRQAGSYAMANGAFRRHHSASTSKLGAFGPINVEEL